MRLSSNTFDSQLFKHIISKFPKICDVVRIERNICWKEFQFRIKTDEHDIGFGTSVKYEVEGEHYIVSTRKLNYELKRLQGNYEYSINKVTEAKFKYQILKMLVAPFVDGKIDDELKFERGGVKSQVILKHKNKKYVVCCSELLEPTPIDELLVYENGFDLNYGIGIPIYEFTNDTENSIKKLKRMSENITKCCLEYYERKEKIDNRYAKIFNQLDSEKQKKIESLLNWKEN